MGSLRTRAAGNLRGGVFWMRDSSFLAIAVAASLATFYLWPWYEPPLRRVRPRRPMHASRHRVNAGRVPRRYEEHAAARFYGEMRQAVGATSDERGVARGVAMARQLAMAMGMYGTSTGGKTRQNPRGMGHAAEPEPTWT